MESTNRLRYLIAGTGGVGGSIAGFLSLAGKDVTCIARGAHLQAIQQDGLKLKSDLKNNYGSCCPVVIILINAVQHQYDHVFAQ